MVFLRVVGGGVPEGWWVVFLRGVGGVAVGHADGAAAHVSGW